MTHGGDESARTPPDPNDPDVLHYKTYPPGSEVSALTLASGDTLVVVRRVRLDNRTKRRHNTH